MSAFSSVDDAAEPRRLIESLEQSAAGLAAMKQYTAVAHSLRRPTLPVLDLGCGAGHDLALFREAGVECVGLDPSSVMLDAAARRVACPLVRGSGERLPFADRAFAGCKIERVLIHVVDPAAVLDEVVRCVQPTGLLTIFEPDWSSLVVNGSPVPAAWVSGVRHPAIGSAVGDLLSAAGCSILDRVEERSSWTLGEFERITNLNRALHRAVSKGHASRRDVDDWLALQQRRADADDFRSEMSKILWVASTPANTNR